MNSEKNLEETAQGNEEDSNKPDLQSDEGKAENVYKIFFLISTLIYASYGNNR